MCTYIVFNIKCVNFLKIIQTLTFGFTQDLNSSLLHESPVFDSSFSSSLLWTWTFIDSHNIFVSCFCHYHLLLVLHHTHLYFSHLQEAKRDTDTLSSGGLVGLLHVLVWAKLVGQLCDYAWDFCVGFWVAEIHSFTWGRKTLRDAADNKPCCVSWRPVPDSQSASYFILPKIFSLLVSISQIFSVVWY